MLMEKFVLYSEVSKRMKRLSVELTKAVDSPKTTHVNMSAKIQFLCLVLVSCYLFLTEFVSCTNLDTEDVFKMRKVNAVWNKALKVIPKGKLRADLFADLLIQDKKERDLKLRKSQGTDIDGLFEAEIRQNLAEILEKYELSTYFPGEKPTARKNERMDRKRKTYNVRDGKLKKLLKTAMAEGFSDGELELLKEELGHHQMKIDEYESLKQEYVELQDKVDNSLDNLDAQDNVYKQMGEKKEQMKYKHKKMKVDFKTIEGRIQDPANKEGKFEDERVYHLWALAQKAGLDEGELESIRTELSHFENRIRKVEFVEDQLKKTEQKIQLGDEVNLHEHEDLKEKSKLYKKKVDKYHEDLKTRIHRKLDEL